MTSACSVVSLPLRIECTLGFRLSQYLAPSMKMMTPGSTILGMSPSNSAVFHNVLDMPADTHRIVPDALNTLSHEIRREVERL
jgi:hypothetical protein